MEIKNAIIPVLELGTQFLPSSNEQPKEILPIVDKPAIQYMVEEAVQSGIESIIIVTSGNIEPIEVQMDRSVELEQKLLEKAWLKKIHPIHNRANIHFIRQQAPLGLGDAILSAQKFMGDDPFAVLLGDDIYVSETPALMQLIRVFQDFDKQIIAVKQVPKKDVNKYGIIESSLKSDEIHLVTDLVEKPDPRIAPSDLAVMGRFILQPSIFPILKKLEKGTGGEYHLTDALAETSRLEGLLALELEGTRFDIGDNLGFKRTNLEPGLLNHEINHPIYADLNNLMGEQVGV